MSKKIKKRVPEARNRRSHTKINDDFLNSDDFKGIFKRITKNDYQIVCIPCTEKNKKKGSQKDVVIYYENLEAHIQTKTHKSAIDLNLGESSEAEEERKKIHLEERKPNDEHDSSSSLYRL